MESHKVSVHKVRNSLQKRFISLQINENDDLKMPLNTSLAKTCRTCCHYDPSGSIQLHPIFKGADTKQPSVELVNIFNEFILWNYEVKLNDGMPQQMCSDCLERFVQVKLFRQKLFACQRLLRSYIRTNKTENVSAAITAKAHSASAGDDLHRTTYVSPSKEIDKMDDLFEIESECLFDDLNQMDLKDPIADNPDPVEEKEQFVDDKKEQSVVHKADSQGLLCSYVQKNKTENVSAPIIIDPVSAGVDVHRDSSVSPSKVNNEEEDVSEIESDDSSQIESIDPMVDNPVPIAKKYEQLVEKNNHNEKEQPLVPQVNCDICEKTYGSAGLLRRHQSSFHNRSNRTCPTCGKIFENVTKWKFVYHLKSHDKKFKCGYCCKSFQKKDHLVQHERVHTKEKPFVCKVCGKNFSQKSQLNYHILTHSSSHSFKCEICGKGFTSPQYVNVHKRTHNPDNIFQCEICGKRLKQKTEFVLHMMIHNDEKPFQCKYCPKAFRLSHTLGSHIQSIHLNNLKSIQNGHYQCTQCDQEFSKPGDLIQHTNSHKDSGSRKFPCLQCEASFKRKPHLDIHVDTMHLKKKPFKCVLCSKTFAQVSQLNVHWKMHENAKEHKCRFCDKGFNLEKTLKSHESTHTGEKCFKCKFCDESFKFRQTLGSHVLTHFRDEK